MLCRVCTNDGPSSSIVDISQSELAQGLATPSDRVATAGVQLKAGHGRLTADGRRVTSSRRDVESEGAGDVHRGLRDVFMSPTEGGDRRPAAQKRDSPVLGEMK